ncbi:hypothetical protein C9374_011533 [Naegleria lovaniensis]|uniref:Uncharacterized protein n=1 Tax=Naegleria lovaniensis TaxID=51637 RepID=A0AA88GXF4_NAELO|nr:uncharacterized protein C9374_011533 [Naegleria lovaniensis]KAG2392808.1 hypothetical protein C9374_011533 [Naegleria lovaniensis]
MPRFEFPLTGLRKFKLDKSSPFYASDRKILKSKATQQLTELLERFNYILILKISGVEQTEIQQLKSAFSDHCELYSEFYVGKHSLTRLAIDEFIQRIMVKNENRDHVIDTNNSSFQIHSSSTSHQKDQEQLISALKQFKELLVGEIALLFTNCEDFSALKKVMSKHLSVKAARVGTVMKEDVYFQGSTGLDPRFMNVFHINNIYPKIRMGQIEFERKEKLLKAREVCTIQKIRMLNMLKLKVVHDQVEPLYLFSKNDAFVVNTEILERDWFENCVESANQITALSMECSLVNELTIIADIKKGIFDLVALDTETQCEMRYMIRKVTPPANDDDSESEDDQNLFESEPEFDLLDLFS